MFYSLPSRRDALKTAAAAGLGSALFVPGTKQAYGKTLFQSEKLNFACIGVGGKGSSDTDDADKYGTVVALCDIDEDGLAKKSKRIPKAKTFVDFREMLDQMGDKIDAVTVSTPDHTHAMAAIAAMKLKKHVFCQKPLTWSIQEARRIREVAKETGVATQMGNQGTAENSLREAVEVVRSGILGEIKEVHIWTNRPVWPQGTGRPKETMEIPKGLHWDLFLGPAPERPYNSAYTPFKWRGWLDFGTGALGDMACHTANMAVMALGLFDPIALTADHTGIVENESYPMSSQIIFEYAKTDKHPALKMTWYDGGRKPDPSLLLGEEMTASGSLVVGTEGSVFGPGDYHGQTKILPLQKFKDAKKPEQTLPRTRNHFEEFTQACAGGPRAMSDFVDYSTYLTETILQGNLAIRAGSGVKLDFDPAAGKVTNLPEINKFLGREYRSGWTLG